jgi:transcriptional regulator with XRE-family HTH domain
VNPKTSDQTPDGGTRAGSADGSLGEQLRRAREARGVSLREISEQTRITRRHLEAIESDDYKHLPGGIFNKSFIKAYARQVRVDEARALELYERTARSLGEYSDEVLTTPQRSRIYTGDPARSPLITAALSAVIVGILILVVYAGLHYYRRTESPGDIPPATPTPGANAAAPAQANPQPQANSAPETAGFNIQIKARGKSFWLTSWQDDEKKRKGRMLSPDKPEEFSPENSLSLKFDGNAAELLDVTINGRPARQPAGGGDTIEWKITKDNYRQFLQ